MTGTEERRPALTGEELIQELEEIRHRILGEHLVNGGAARAHTIEDIAKRLRQRRGGSNVVKRNAERYLNCTEKEVRRFQLRKLVDEAGEDTFGGKWPAHATLDRWEALEFGLTDEEMDQLAREDKSPEQLITGGWWMDVHRSAPWPIPIGTALVGEGEKRNPRVREVLIKDLEQARVDYRAMGVADVERALISKTLHSGVDVEHADFDAAVISEFVDTPELQEEMRKAFILRIQMGQRGEW